MFKRRRRRKPIKRKKPIMKRFLRSFMSIIILTAFVLGLAYSVKKISTMEPDQAVKLTGPILKKLGISEEEAGEVAGEFAERLMNTNIAPAKTNEAEDKTSSDSAPGDSNTDISGGSSSRNVILKAALMSDSQNDEERLKKALDTAASEEVDVIFFLGDYSNLGTLDSLEKSKSLMDSSGIKYYSLPGDRDLYDTVGPQNFHKVFGVPDVLVNIKGVTFVLLDNSANYTLIDTEQMRQYETALTGADFVLMSQPLYHPLASYGKPVMGLVKGETVNDVKEQATDLLGMIRSSDVNAIIAADHHSFSESEDVKDDELMHYVIGPVTGERSDMSKTSISVLSVFDDGTYKVREVTF